MSVDSARQFIDQIDQDAALQSAVGAPASVNLSEIGIAHGYEFTQEELHEELRQRWQMKQPEDSGSARADVLRAVPDILQLEDQRRDRAPRRNSPTEVSS